MLMSEFHFWYIFKIKMQIFEDFKIRFEQPNWKNYLELGLID